MVTCSKNRSLVFDSLGPKGNKLSEFQVVQLTPGSMVPKLWQHGSLIKEEQVLWVYKYINIQMEYV